MACPSIWRCLIVEDDRDNARYLADGLKSLGHIAIVCHDGSTALTRATGESSDLIVLDRMLPQGVDGLSILTHLRALGQRTPVLVLSALSALDERVRGLKAGGDDYLCKPFAFSELASNLALGFSSASAPATLLFCFFGVLLGTLIGVLPGIGALATISLLPLPSCSTCRARPHRRWPAWTATRWRGRAGPAWPCS